MRQQRGWLLFTILTLTFLSIMLVPKNVPAEQRIIGGQVIYDDVKLEDISENCPDRSVCNGDFELDFAFWGSTENAVLSPGRTGQGVQVSYDGANADLEQMLSGVFEGGKTYRATTWCLADQIELCSLFFGDANLVYGQAYENEVSQTLWGIGTWQKLSVTHTMTHDERMNVYVYAKFPGSTVIYDDIQVEEVQTFPLTVTKSGTGSGTVTGEGIACGTDCTELYYEGTLLNLKAIPAADSTFAGWLVNGSPATEMISVEDEITVTAIFEKKM